MVLIIMFAFYSHELKLFRNITLERHKYEWFSNFWQLLYEHNALTQIELELMEIWNALSNFSGNGF